MKICLLQAKHSDYHVLHEHVEHPDPGRHVSQYEFHHRFVEKANFRQQIDGAVAERFDFYFNFMWGQPEDEVAGVEATKYLESFDVSIIGYRSHILMKSKSELYQAARKRGSPPVPGNDINHFPVIVKAARTFASRFMNEKSLCHTAVERDAAIAEINLKLQPGRARGESYKASGGESLVHIPHEGAPVSIDNLPNEIIVHEFVPGTDYSVVVIEFGVTPIALNPMCYNYPSGENDSPGQFLAREIKFHPKLHATLINRDNDPQLYDTLSKLAVEAFIVNGMRGSSWGIVNIRVKPDGEPVVIEVNPMPAIFLPETFPGHDAVILHSLPGAHRALLNITFASYMMQSEQNGQARLRQIGEAYDKIAPIYDNQYLSQSTADAVLTSLLIKVDFGGSMLDLACGTGVFGRMIRAKHSTESQCSRDKKARHVGVDISPEMARIAELAGYDYVLVGPIQECLPKLSETLTTSCVIKPLTSSAPTRFLLCSHDALCWRKSR